MNLITSALIRITQSSGERSMLTLPGVYAALVRDEVESFSALRAHQRQAWHAFLAQVGALALLASGHVEPPEDEAGWADLLRGLTPDHPFDEPWCLIALPERPALLQPPIPSGQISDLRNTVATPDALDILVTAKNHDLKTEVMARAAPDDWLFALVTLQTMQGYFGAGNFGISRMNGGFANRAAVGATPLGGPGVHLRRDLRRLLALRPTMLNGFASAGGLGLLWLRPWDGTHSLLQSELDPYYVEVCRRVRLFKSGGLTAARAGGSKVPRVAPFARGLTGDPWAPVVREREGSKAFTVDLARRG